MKPAAVLRMLDIPKMILDGANVRSARPLDAEYLFSAKARRALFFAKDEASRRDTDCITNHITIEDIIAGIARENGQKPKKGSK